MKKRNVSIIVVLLVSVVYCLIANLPYLPGPNGWVSEINTVFNGIQLLSISTALIFPIGLIWLIVVFFKKTSKYKIPLLLTWFPLLGMLNMNTIHPQFMGMSRERAIENAAPLISAINIFYNNRGVLPDSASILVPDYLQEIPSSGSIGISDYSYELQDSTYEIKFFQNAILSFNYEVVVYNPDLKHLGEGKMPELRPTSDPYWKYYLFD